MDRLIVRDSKTEKLKEIARIKHFESPEAIISFTLLIK